MACTQSFKVTTVSFVGINHSPISKTVMIKPGGVMQGAGIITNAGRRYSGDDETKGGEVEFELPYAEYNNNDFAKQCGDLIVLTADGRTFLMTNAVESNEVEIKEGEGKVKLKFYGDAIDTF